MQTEQKQTGYVYQLAKETMQSVDTTHYTVRCQDVAVNAAGLVVEPAPCEPAFAPVRVVQDATAGLYIALDQA